MLAIKLQRVGRKHSVSYRVVVAEKRSKMEGPPVEMIGFYNPVTKEISINKERASYWLGVGAIPTITTHNLLIGQGIVSGKKIAIKIKKKETSSNGDVAEVKATPEVESIPDKSSEQKQEEVKQDDVKTIESEPEVVTVQEKPAEPSVEEKSVEEKPVENDNVSDKKDDNAPEESEENKPKEEVSV